MNTLAQSGPREEVAMSDDAIKHFSDSYPLARRLFLEAAAVTKASVKSYKHPTCGGAAGEKLFIDVATVGNPKSRHALVLMSGTHGIEGYCGSAIQTGFLHSNVMQQAPHIKVILVHALNPFGFSHLRRPNENNIDLNRNFIDFHEIPSSESYNRFATVLHQKPTLLARARLIAYIFSLGFRTIQEAVTRGQYQHPDGLFFGGREESWTRQMWSTILNEHLHDAAEAFFIDYHTGLGKYGTGQILCTANPESTAGLIARRTVSGIFGGEVKFLQDAKAGTVRPTKASHSEIVATPPSGDILNFTIESRKDGSFSGVFLEFGTLGRFAVLEALMMENATYQRPQNPLDTQASKTKLQKAFYPNDPNWRNAVWKRGLEVTSRVAQALNTRV